MSSRTTVVDIVGRRTAGPDVRHHNSTTSCLRRTRKLSSCFFLLPNKARKMGFASFPSRLSRTSRSFFGFPRWCHSRHPQPTPSQSIKIESPQGTPNKDKNMRPPTLLLLPLLSSAFTAPHYHKAGAVGTALRVAAEPETDDINLILNGNNIDLTPALSSYVEKRIGSPLRKLGSGGVVRDVDVHLSVYKNPKVCQGYGSDHDEIRTIRRVGLIVEHRKRSFQKVLKVYAAVHNCESPGVIGL